jgi:type I restriction enzyme S subunit
VLVAKDGNTNLKYIFVVERELDVVLLSSIAILRPNGRIPSNQLALYLRLPYVKDRLRGYVSGAAIPRVILRDFKQFKAVVAPVELHDKWARLCDPMLALCRQLVRKNVSLRTARDLLLPRLISGELNVTGLPQPEAAAA